MRINWTLTERQPAYGYLPVPFDPVASSMLSFWQMVAVGVAVAVITNYVVGKKG